MSTLSWRSELIWYGPKPPSWFTLIECLVIQASCKQRHQAGHSRGLESSPDSRGRRPGLALGRVHSSLCAKEHTNSSVTQDSALSIQAERPITLSIVVWTNTIQMPRKLFCFSCLKFWTLQSASSNAVKI